ncbi:MAG: hypothetical protein IPK26_25635 [Planctomycetes bacterium]|nr:hypothetical protein [Planctomycetota bacterium]
MPAEPIARPSPERLTGAAAERVVAVHRQAIARYLKVLGASAQELDDLLQQTFLVLLERPFDDRDHRSTRTFLRTTARQLFLRRHRDRLPQVRAADEVWDRRCGDDDGDSYLSALRECVAALPARSRALLQHAYDERHGRLAIGERLGMTMAGVKTALRRLRTALRQCIERRLSR